MEIYDELMLFNNFLLTMFVIMPFTKHIPKLIVNKEHVNYKVAQRKINQYTNWNIFMIGCNYILYNYYAINNIFISKFLALNSFHICLMYHIFVLYDKRILFDIIDNTRPFMLRFGGKYDILCIKLEYIILNFLIHILPVYIYKDYLVQKMDPGYNINMCVYTILFKFMWALNVFGNFDVISIYLPSFNFCSIKLFNILVMFDYGTSMIIEMYRMK